MKIQVLYLLTSIATLLTAAHLPIHTHVRLLVLHHNTKKLFNQYQNKTLQPRRQNGCGPVWLGWLVPEYRFHECCNNHDVCFENCTNGTLERCNHEFFQCMQSVCHVHGLNNLPKRSLFDWFGASEEDCLKTADLYYDGVDNAFAGHLWRNSCEG